MSKKAKTRSKPVQPAPSPEQLAAAAKKAKLHAEKIGKQMLGAKALLKAAKKAFKDAKKLAKRARVAASAARKALKTALKNSKSANKAAQATKSKAAAAKSKRPAAKPAAPPARQKRPARKSAAPKPVAVVAAVPQRPKTKTVRKRIPVATPAPAMEVLPATDMGDLNKKPAS